jgi:chromate transport protein ChrA
MESLIYLLLLFKVHIVAMLLLLICGLVMQAIHRDVEKRRMAQQAEIIKHLEEQEQVK